jgi:chitin disaccharide deacetylase
MSAPSEGTASRRGLLIVNADDWGGFKEGTDAIEECFAAGAISSTTAMVNMADSLRAAELARERGRPVGLHLNLTQPFDTADVPPQARERQLRLCAHFADLPRRRWRLSLDPRVRRLVADGIRDQLEEFRARYEREPTHVDSHHHVHLCPDVFLSRALTPGIRVRQTLSFAPAAGHRGLRGSARRAKHELLARRFVTTACFWRAGELSEGDGAVPIAEAAAYAADSPVEIMVHPSFASDLAVLRSDAWHGALHSAPLAPYSSLSRDA